jgi:uncharacterized protein YkwD
MISICGVKVFHGEPETEKQKLAENSNLVKPTVAIKTSTKTSTVVKPKVAEVKNDPDFKVIPGGYNESYALSVKVGIEIVRLTNEYRKKKGVEPMQIWNKDLHDECYRHSIYMANKDAISHDNFRHRVGFMNRLGYNVKGGYENVA